MNGIVFRELLVACLVSLILLPVRGEAQFETTLGTLNSTGQTFACVDQVGETIKILVTSSSGKQRLLSKTAAKRTLAKLKRALNKRANNLKRLKKKKENQIVKLIRSVSLVPSFKKSEKIAKLRLDIEKLDVRLAELVGDRDLSGVIKSQVDSCVVELIGNGKNIQILENGSSPIYGSSYFVIAAVHAFQFNYERNGSQVCAEIDGVVQKMNVTVSRCTNIQDLKPGNPTGAEFRVCYNLPESVANASIVLRFGAGYYHDTGRFDEVTKLINEALSQNVRVYLPDANGQC